MMKNLAAKFVTSPTFTLNILLISIGMLISPAVTLASYSEDELSLESWMATPFDQSFDESELIMESWMATPFNQEFEESEPTLESWMAAPFNQEFGESELFLETWMVTTWF